MIVSVTTLGSSTGDAVGAAAQVIDYVDGRGSHEVERFDGRGSDRAVRAAGYYADSADGAGIWMGRGMTGMAPAGRVDPEALRRALLGQDLVSGAPLIGGPGAAARADQRGRQDLGVSSAGDPLELLSLGHAAALVGVSPRYLRKVAAETVALRSRQATQRAAGESVEKTPATFLDAAQGSCLGRWRVTRSELERFATARRGRRVVIGYDLTFSCPKSVSVLWACADARGQAEILAAVHAAVGAGIAYLEAHAAFVQVPARAGHAPSGREEATGLLAAAYLHATSRDLDPQLHHHVVVANMAERRRDGAVRALDGRALYAHATTAGYLAAAELRTQLTRRLGVAWEPVERGVADVAGVPAAALEEMSQRSRAMKDFLAERTAQLPDEAARRWSASPAARQMAAYQTRAPKDSEVDPAALRRGWAARLEAVGFDRRAAAACYERQAAVQLVTAEDRAALFSDLGSATGVTHTAATFDRRDVIQSVATWAGDRLGAAEVCDLADEWLATAAVVRLDTARRQGRSADAITLADGRRISAVGDEALYTTRSMLGIEERIFAAYERGRVVGAGVVGADELSAALAAAPHVGADQAAMVASVTTSGHRIQCVVGPAGAGKTTALAAAVAAWEAAGYRVLGAAVQGTAAEVLGLRAGVASSTVASLLARMDLGQPVIDARSVVLVDESSTLANRDLARLAAHVEAAGAALRLVGDPAQHSAVAAGGAWRALLERHPSDAAVLTEARRQRGPEMAEVRLALADYRQGRVAEALERLHCDARVVEAGSADELLDALVADWYVDRQRRQADPSLAPSAMVAEHHVERRELNRRARALLAADGTLAGPVLATPEAEFQAGDEVIARTAERSLRPEGGGRRSHVTNGLRGTVIEVRPNRCEGGALVVDFERRGTVTVPYEALSRRLRAGVVGILGHAYALTSQAAQGDTFQAARHLATERSTRAGVYVGLSRGVDDCRLYLLRRSELLPLAEEHPELSRLTTETSIMQAVTARLTAERQDSLALEADPDAAAVARLRDAHDVGQLAALAASDAPAAALAKRALVDQLAAVAAAACLHPDPALVARLGSRPAPGPSRERWEAAVGAVAVLAARWGPLQPDGTAGPAGWALGAVRPEAAADYAAAAAALREAEIGFAASRPAAELAREHAELADALVVDPTARRREDAQSGLALQRSRLADRQGDHDRAVRRLGDLEAAPRRRRNGQGVEAARRQAAAAKQAMAVAAASLVQAEDRLRAVEVGFAAQAPLRERLEVLDAALDAKVAEAVERCPDYLSSVLGPPSPDATGRESWETAAKSIEGYRHRVLGLEPDHGAVLEGTGLQPAIGAEPADLVSAVVWRSAARSIEPERVLEIEELGISL